MESALKRNSSICILIIFPHLSVHNNTIFTVIFMFRFNNQYVSIIHQSMFTIEVIALAKWLHTIL